MAQKGGAAQVTTDHEFIKEWVEARGGCPAAVKRTSRGGSPGIIRVDYPGFSGQKSLEPISWDEFFQKFDEHELAFLYQEQTADGQPSRFSKIVGRETAQARENGKKRARRSAGGPRGRQARTASSARTGGRTQRSTAKAKAKANAKEGGKKEAGAKGRTRAAAGRRGASPRGTTKTAARGGGTRKTASTRKASGSRSASTRRATGGGRSASLTRQPSKARKPQSRGARKPRSR